MKKATEKIAKFTTRCKHCDELIVAGIDRMKVHHDVWVHVECYDDYRAQIDEQMLDDEQVAVSLCQGDCECKASIKTYTITFTRTETFVEEVKANDLYEALQEVTLNYLDENTVINSITEKV